MNCPRCTGPLPKAKLPMLCIWCFYKIGGSVLWNLDDSGVVITRH